MGVNELKERRKLKTINENKNITGKKCNSAPLREHIPEMHQSQLLNSSQEQRNRMLSESRFGFYDTQLNCTLRQRIICFQTGCYQQKCYREKKKKGSASLYKIHITMKSESVSEIS